MTSKLIVKSLLMSGLLLLQPIIGDNFIFDLGGVLIDTDTFASLRHIGIKNIAQCMVYLKKGPMAINNHIELKLFEILNKTALTYNLAPKTTNNNAYDKHGRLLPYFMCSWLNGTMTSEKIRSLTLVAIKLHPEWFDHVIEQCVITNLITMVFTPEHFVATRKIYHNGIAFIKACKQQGHRVYVLSNWDTESFELLQKKYSNLFNLFDGIVISGESNILKPAPEIYTTLLNRYQLKATKCWFIDDQKENVVAACTVGIHGIICNHSWPRKKPNFHLIAQNIKDYYYKSVTRREKRSTTGTNPKIIKNTSSPIIVGEKIS